LRQHWQRSSELLNLEQIESSVLENQAAFSTSLKNNDNFRVFGTEKPLILVEAGGMMI
jgi:hypothetical protein